MNPNLLTEIIKGISEQPGILEFLLDIIGLMYVPNLEEALTARRKSSNGPSNVEKSEGFVYVVMVFKQKGVTLEEFSRYIVFS